MLISWVEKIPWRREQLPTPIFWSGEFHGLYSPWDHKESDLTEQLNQTERITRRDKKAFLSGQCKEIEENNGMGKTRDLFKKIRATKGTFHAKMGSIKDRNGMDLTEADSIKKR